MRHFSLPRCILTSLAGAACLAITLGDLHADEQRTVQQRRTAVLVASDGSGAEAVRTLREALDDPDPVVRRTATRGLTRQGESASKALVEAIGNSDALVRRTAIIGFTQVRGTDALPQLSEAIEDSSPFVRHAAVQMLALLQSKSNDATAMLRSAAADEHALVREAANELLWPFNEPARSSAERPDVRDLPLESVLRVQLPAEAWCFRTDPKLVGHTRGWFEPDFNDDGWTSVGIEQAWEEFGHEYDGVAWYRRTFELPDAPPHEGADLLFDGVDESAWVWLNGEFVGQHDIGARGWNEPFRVDITGAVRWGGKNQITVRVLDREMAGGIWKPVYVDVLARQ